MRTPVQIDGAEGVLKAADHVDDGGQLDHGDGPDTGHDHGQTGRITGADVVLIGVARRCFPLPGLKFLLGFGFELGIGRPEHEGAGARAQVHEPGAGQIERRLRALLVQIVGGQGPQRRIGRLGAGGGPCQTEGAERQDGQTKTAHQGLPGLSVNTRPSAN